MLLPKGFYPSFLSSVVVYSYVCIRVNKKSAIGKVKVFHYSISSALTEYYVCQPVRQQYRSLPLYLLYEVQIRCSNIYRLVSTKTIQARRNLGFFADLHQNYMGYTRNVLGIPTVYGLISSNTTQARRNSGFRADFCRNYTGYTRYRRAEKVAFEILLSLLTWNEYEKTWGEGRAAISSYSFFAKTGKVPM